MVHVFKKSRAENVVVHVPSSSLPIRAEQRCHARLSLFSVIGDNSAELVAGGSLIEQDGLRYGYFVSFLPPTFNSNLL